MNPQISIIVPCFNSSKTIGCTIKSLQVQTEENIEIICVDDASSDDTCDIIYSIQKLDSRVSCIRLLENHGVHLARAFGIARANAPWIGFLDSDDLMEPTMCEELLAAAQTAQADIAICGSLRVTSAGSSLGAKVYFPNRKICTDQIFESFCRLEYGTGALWNKLYRHELIAKWANKTHRWKQNGTEDTLVNIGCFWDAKRLVLIPDILHKYVHTSGSLTEGADGENGFSKILRAYAIAVDIYAGLGPKMLAGIANLYRAQLEYPCYTLSYYNSISEWDSDLAEPLIFLAEKHPASLAMLVARLSKSDNLSRGSFSRRLLKRILNCSS